MEITTYYLEMNSASSLKEKKISNGLVIRECEINQFQYNRFLYQLVGEVWMWTDKLTLSNEQWKAYVDDDNLRTWVAYLKGSPAGYFELQKQLIDNVEIKYFGLAAKFVGVGFGGYLLSQALKYAWDWKGTKRVWLHTCSLDHQSALKNYEARGMKVYKIENTNQRSFNAAIL